MTSFPLAHLISKRSAGRIPFAGFLPDSIPESIKPHPNPISLAGGEPYHEFFPVHSLQVEVTDTPFYGKRSEISSESDRVNSQLLTPADSIDSLNQKENSFSFTINRTSNKEQCIGIDKGLQYAHTAGLKPMLDFTFEFIEKTNKPAFRNYDITLTNGSGNSLHRIAELLVDEGDTFLVEEFTYKPFCQQVTNFGGMPIPVKLDFYGEGIHYESLKDLLENWSKYYPGLKKPKGLYTICNGQNPSGLTQIIICTIMIYIHIEADFASTDR
ncbi:hypothetical protein PACTADRAFT_35747 [Pachysolen tannophilus NRRL Y-2460]|uniref:Aminotransferase class I/classII domain-containing protein n=1 Tax=Pachysolen tannophilus NRRL Y-2460 TaxID=669874 RepID=A0A1E4TQQ9_PACTA|nr:hypothetical protein PACTADRAFT_35747 [Pachysolen tannophilus NRRL Y-2460]